MHNDKRWAIKYVLRMHLSFTSIRVTMVQTIKIVLLILNMQMIDVLLDLLIKNDDHIHNFYTAELIV